MVKKRTRTEPTQAAIEAFASQAEDVPAKPIKKAQDVSKELARTTISLPAELLEKVEDMALKNKRAKLENRTVSATVRAAPEQYMK
mgnify:CR=1 FL=1